MARVLIIEPDSPLARVLTTLLRSDGHQIHLRDRPPDLRSIPALQPDLVVLDPGHRLPASARTFLNEVAPCYSFPVMLITTDPALVAHPPSNVHAVLPKPFDPDRLLEAVRRLLQCE